MIKAKLVKFNIIKPGLVGLPDKKAVGYLSHEELIKGKDSYLGSPLFIQHQDYQNAKKEDLLKKFSGVIANTEFDVKTGWLVGHGYVFDDNAIELLKNGTGVSSTYTCDTIEENGVESSIPYNLKITNPKFIDLCIVDRPRYTGAKAIEILNSLNLKDVNESNFHKYNISNTFEVDGREVFENHIPSQYASYGSDFNSQSFIPIARDEGDDEDILKMFEDLIDEHTAKSLGIEWDTFNKDLKDFRERSTILFNSNTKKTIENADHVLMDGTPLLIYVAIKIFKRELKEKMKLMQQGNNQLLMNSINDGSFIDMIFNRILDPSETKTIDGVSYTIQQIIDAVRSYYTRMRENQIIKEKQRMNIDQGKVPSSSPYEQHRPAQPIVNNVENQAPAATQVENQAPAATQVENQAPAATGQITLDQNQLNTLIQNAVTAALNSQKATKEAAAKEEAERVFNSFDRQVERFYKATIENKVDINSVDFDDPDIQDKLNNMLYDDTKIK